MKRNKNLERAVILGLLLSTGVYGTVFAEQLKDGPESNVNWTDVDGDGDIKSVVEAGDGGSGNIFISGNVDISGKLTIINTQKDETGGKGINAYNGPVNITATEIEIQTYDDGIFTTGPATDGPKADNTDINVKEFNSLKIISTNGFGVINNGNSYGNGGWFGNPNTATNKGDIYITGNENSIINIQGGYKNNNTLDAKAAVKNGYKGKIIQDNSTDYKTVVSGGSINLNGVGYGTWAETGTVEVNGSYNTIKAVLDDRFKEEYNLNAYKNFGIGVYNQKASSTTNINATELNIIHGDKEAVYASGGNVTITGKNNYFDVSYNEKIVREDLKETVQNVDRYAIHTTSGNVKSHATAGDNVIESIAAGIYGAGKGTVTLTADNGKNIIYAGNMIEGLDDYGNTILYGDNYGIKSENGNVTTLEAGVNNIKGAIYANGNGSTVYSREVGNVTANNHVYSAAVIEEAGDLLGKTTNDNGDGTFTTSGMDVVSAVYGEEGAQINLSGVNDIRTYYDDPKDEHTSERAVWAYKGADITIDGLTNISTYAYNIPPENRDIAIAAGTATELTDKDFTDTALEEVQKNLATVNLNYKAGSSISGDILAAYGGEVHITDANPATKSAAGSGAATGIAITGDLLAGNTGKLTVDLGNGGRLTGRADDYGDASTEHLNFYNPAFSSNIIQGGDVTLNMGDESQWNVQGQSWITNVNTTGNVTIDLTSAENEYQNYNSHALTIRNLNGDANIKMNLNGDRSASDMLYIGQGNGEYNIELANLVTVGDMYAPSDDNSFNFSGLRFATVGMGSDVTFNVTAKGQGFNNVRYTVGTDEYNSDISAHENDAYNGGDDTTLAKPGNAAVEDILDEAAQAQNQANQIMLLAEETEPANDNKTQHLNYKLVAMESDGFTDAGRTVLNMSRANYSNAIYMDRLNKRLGEARYINDNPEEDEGMWVRIRHDRIGKEDAFRSQNTMYELGYDKRQECDNGKRRVGFAVDYMHGDTGYNDIAGKGEIDRYGLWLYDTWTGNKGHYVDYVAKWGHLQNDFEVYNMGDNQKVTGDYSNNVFSVSAEYGRKKDMGNDWYFEPQAQLQLARVTGANYTTSQGTKVSVDGINSLIGRAGFRIGKDFGEEKQSTLYFKADVLHEFLGDQTIRALDGTTNGWQTVDYENQGTWYDIGIGYAAMLSQSTYAFVDLEQSFGNDNDDTYQINAGVRWTF